MGWKRKKGDNAGSISDDGEEGGHARKEQRMKKKEGIAEVEKKREILPSMIKNKEKRSAVHAKLKHQKKVEKRKK
ncbi:hypothetical protein Tsubulata_013645 [Turnera subulata]|uniref:Uncharacterized protein n=1 Tax=Turnera subulata TaxID=218843 RepID=A0A9Q0JP17_9ROSI|nr:hypothetical protein Tsubulata_013645 [Turnera subulata]